MVRSTGCYYIAEIPFKQCLSEQNPEAHEGICIREAIIKLDKFFLASKTCLNHVQHRNDEC